MTRCGVHEAGAGVVGDVIAGEKRDRELIATAETAQRMRTFHRIQRIGGQVADLLIGW